MALAYRIQNILCVVLFCLIVLGAGVRIAGAGLACPDWPLCFGEAVPTFNFQIFMEWIHRVIAGISGFLALTVTLLVFRNGERKTLGKWLILSLFLFGIQGFLGRQTVLQLLRADTVTSHLVGGYSLFALNVFIVRKWKLGSQAIKSHPARWIFLGILLLAFIQATLGGLVSSHYAGLACDGFPKCQGQWWPSLVGAVAYHFVHRLGAFILLIAGVGLALTAYLKNWESDLRRLTLMGLGFVLLQWVWGVSMVFTEIHPGLSLAHSATSLAIFTTFLVGTYRGFGR